MTTDPQPLRAVIGERVRAVREASGARQQDLADAARSLGFTTWTRSRIAAIERGNKATSAEDLIRVIAILQMSVGRPIPLDELLDSRFSIALSDTASIPAAAMADVLHDGDAQSRISVSEPVASPNPLDTPQREAAALRVQRLLKAAGRTTLPTVGETRAVALGIGETDERAARDLELDPYTYETLCLLAWGRSLSAERDARLTEAGGDVGSPSSVARRRGQLTRSLVGELRGRLAVLEGGDDGEHPAQT